MCRETVQPRFGTLNGQPWRTCRIDTEHTQDFRVRTEREAFVAIRGSWLPEQHPRHTQDRLWLSVRYRANSPRVVATAQSSHGSTAAMSARSTVAPPQMRKPGGASR